MHRTDDPNAVSWRKAAPEDVEFLARVVLLAHQDRYRLRADWDRDAFFRGLIDDARDQVAGGPEHSTTYVIMNGTIRVGRLRLVITADRVEIAGLQILPVHQSQGLGTAVVEDVLDLAERERLLTVLEVELDNPDARRLYERLGFVATEEIRGDRQAMIHQSPRT